MSAKDGYPEKYAQRSKKVGKYSFVCDLFAIFATDLQK